jgi:orotidine-5'-phosphate decarboxylase
MRPFADRLTEAAARRSPAVVGIDPHLALLPAAHRERVALGRAQAGEAVRDWCRIVLDAVDDLVPAIKPQVAFFEQLGAPGWAALEDVCAEARRRGLLVIADAKRGDIGSTAEAYAMALLDDSGPIGADALTASPWLGRDSLAPLVKTCDTQGKGLFVLVRTSNPGGGELQAGDGAARVAGWVREWNATRRGESGYGPVGAVVGATVPDEARELRAVLAGAIVLVPGYGAQGGSARDAAACFDPGRRGAVVNSARGVTFPAEGDRAAYDADPASVIRRQALAFVRDLAVNIP